MAIEILHIFKWLSWETIVVGAHMWTISIYTHKHITWKWRKTPLPW